MADEWFWAGSLSQGDSDFGDGETSWGYEPNQYAYGSVITCNKSGTCTKLASYCRQGDGTISMKIGLYNASGTILAQSTFTNDSSTLNWEESGAISVSVSATNYIVMVSAAARECHYGYDSAEDSIGDGMLYADAMDTPISTTENETGTLFGVKMWVEDAAAAADTPIPPKIIITERKIWQVPAQIGIAALPIIGALKNNLMTRREFPNPWNWVKKKK